MDGSSNELKPVEKLYTIQEAASVLNIHAWKIRRAIKRGLIPSYALLNTRRLVRIRDIEAALVVGGRS